MENINVTIQYLFNSGFAVQTKNCFLVFDYYKGPVSLGSGSIYVFSSHGHPDHFNKEIFKWQERNESIQYILSDDIHPRHKAENIHYISADEELVLDNINVKTLGSTDLGVAFLVQIDGICIFHAGDLNWWYWPDDTEEEIKTMAKMFKAEITKLKGKHIDIAFFPVDPRLEHNYSLGGEYFIKEISPKFFIPMHFGEDYTAVSSFADVTKDHNSSVLVIQEKGQIINL